MKVLFSVKNVRKNTFPVSLDLLITWRLEIGFQSFFFIFLELWKMIWRISFTQCPKSTSNFAVRLAFQNFFHGVEWFVLTFYLFFHQTSTFLSDFCCWDLYSEKACLSRQMNINFSILLFCFSLNLFLNFKLCAVCYVLNFGGISQMSFHFTCEVSFDFVLFFPITLGFS